MTALFVAFGIGALAPNVALTALDGRRLEVADFRGSFAALVSGLSLADGTDARTAQSLALYRSAERPFGLAVLVGSASESLSARAQELGVEDIIFLPDAGALEALDLRSGGLPARRALLLNPSGRLVKVWDVPKGGGFVHEFTEWMDGSSLPIGYEAPDPRPLLGIGSEADAAEEGEALVREDRGLLVMFLSSRGPVDELYTDRIRGLASRSQEVGVDVLGLFPNGYETPEGVASFAAASGFQFPCVVDVGSAFSDAYRATVTPEAFLLLRSAEDGTLRVFYTGSIDSSTRDLQTNRRYLLDALEALASGGVASPAKTLPFGTGIARGDVM